MKADNSHAQLLRQLEERLLQPDVRRSSAAVGDLLADEFMEFGSSGRIFNKQQIIDALRGEATPSQRLVLDFRTSVLAPGVVLATYRLTRSDSDGEAATHSLRSSIWKLVGQRWQMVFHQGTASRAL
jgi:hypothetical protein